MPKELERDLGLFAVVAISMGAMIGSGIFILPGIAMAEAGPAVILAFVVASILVVPAALSIAELGTAMPEAGGDYIFIERGMGPGAGTIAGLGTWLMLMFKGALALVGGMIYLDFVLALPSHEATAIVIGTILIGVNIFGVKQTGGLQTIMVAVMLFILGAFVALSITSVESANYDGFFAEGSAGLFSATATVVVSYAGVTKVASVAEEIENPSRNLPLGLLVSLVATTFLYALIVFVLVGVVEGDALRDDGAPMATAVEPFGVVAVAVIVLAAMLALISTANAGILTASRYPLALSRDDLLPALFSRIHDRFQTPMIAILVTGGAMLAIILLFDVEQIAKSAGSFQIVVYILVNLALIAFRERDLEWYDPDFTSPAYPWMQLFGVGSGVFIISRMDPLPLAGGVGIVVLGALWYWWYGKDRVEREGVAVDALRRETGRRAIDDTRRTIENGGSAYEVLIPIRREVSREREDTLLRLAAPLVKARNGRIRVVRFREVPDQVPLEEMEVQTADDIAFEERTDELAAELDVPVEVGEIVSHDTRHAVVNFADRTNADLILGERDTTGRLQTLLGSESDWILEHAPCDVVFVQNHGLDELDEIAVVTDRSAFKDPLKVTIADALANAHGARLRLLFAVDPSAPDTLIDGVEDYYDELAALCSAPVEYEVLRTDDAVEDLAVAAGSADLTMLSLSANRRVPNLLLSPRSDRIAARLDDTALLVSSDRSTGGTFLRPIVERVLFRSGTTN